MSIIESSSAVDFCDEHADATELGSTTDFATTTRPVARSRFDGKTKPAEQPVDKSVSHPLPRTLRERFSAGINVGNVLWMAGIHIGAIAAFWFFSWQAFVLFALFHFASACLGVTLGYHRLLTHGSFIVPRWLKYFFSICGMLSTEGSPLYWVASHRKHHVLSDKEGDPHSPNEGFWWSQMLWFMPKESPEALRDLYKRWAPDLYKDPVQRFFDKVFPLIAFTFGILIYTFGEVVFGLGVSFLLWGLCLRMVVCYHSTWFVNSATHIWGYRNYVTDDRSRNLWWVAALTYGEGWHNNHHAHQRLARHGHKRWEIDPTYMVIWLLSKVGLAKQVQNQIPSDV